MNTSAILKKRKAKPKQRPKRGLKNRLETETVTELKALWGQDILPNFEAMESMIKKEVCVPSKWAEMKGVKSIERS
jgi:hypothetical protein